MNKIIKLLLSFLVFTAFNSFAAEANYVNLFDKKGSPFSVGSEEVRIFDVAFPTTHCAPEAKYVCVLSKVFVFSVPKDIEGTSSWSHAGAHYKIVSKKEELIRGEILEYRVIRQEWKHNVIDYAYSKDYGVLAINNKNGHVITMLEKCGFAAISSVHGCDKY